MLINIFRVGVKRIGPIFFQWCREIEQGGKSTNWSIRSSSWTWGRSSLLWGLQSTRTGCPEGLYILLPQRYAKPAWTQFCATYSRWTCIKRWYGLFDLQRSLPNPAILWFWGSVILWSTAGGLLLWTFSWDKSTRILTWKICWHDMSEKGFW